MDFGLLIFAIINAASALLAAFVAREKAATLDRRRIYFAWLVIAAITGPFGLIAAGGGSGSGQWLHTE